MHEISTAGELASIAGGDPLIAWAGQGEVGGRVRAWYSGDAVAVATPELSKFNRVTVRGPVDDLAPLARNVLAEAGPGFRLFGEEPLIRELVERIPELSFVAAFGWMDTRVMPARTTTAAWLDGDSGVQELLDEASPDSFAWPSSPGVLRWAAVLGEAGELLSIAADAWSAPEIGFMAGVATRPSARGQGLSRQVCTFVTAELMKRHGQVGLMVHHDNEPAIAVYRKLGYTYRRVAAASV